MVATGGSSRHAEKNRTALQLLHASGKRTGLLWSDVVEAPQRWRKGEQRTRATDGTRTDTLASVLTEESTRMPTVAPGFRSCEVEHERPLLRLLCPPRRALRYKRRECQYPKRFESNRAEPREINAVTKIVGCCGFLYARAPISPPSAPVFTPSLLARTPPLRHRAGKLLAHSAAVKSYQGRTER